MACTGTILPELLDRQQGLSGKNTLFHESCFVEFHERKDRTLTHASQYALGVRHLAFVTTQTTFAKTSRRHSKYRNHTKAVTSTRAK